jgi:hypothetical protein
MAGQIAKIGTTNNTAAPQQNGAIRKARKGAIMNARGNSPRAIFAIVRPVTIAAAGPPAAPAEGFSLFTALQEQLGLKLESERGPVRVLVIDHVERPKED